MINWQRVFIAFPAVAQLWYPTRQGYLPAVEGAITNQVYRSVKMSLTIEVKLSLAEEMVRQLHERAQRWGVSEAVVVEQALGLLFAQDDPSPLSDYWFAVSAMREDWEAMPEDWDVAEVDNGVSTR